MAQRQPQHRTLSRPLPPAGRRFPAVALTRTAAAIQAALLIGLAVGTALVAAPPAQAQTAGQTDARRSFDIPAGPLGRALNDFASAAGVELSVDAALLADKASAGLSGNFSVPEGFAALLSGHGLQATRQANGSYTLSKLATGGAVVLPAVKVNAQVERDATNALQNEGGAKDGYRARTASSVGALGSMNLRDAPFSISVVPRELIQNIQAQAPEDIYKLNPSTRSITAQGTGWTPIVSIRGFKTNDTAEDGLRRPYNHAAVVEDKERVEVLSGLSGFLYGAAAPAGIINYVYKRPTLERLNSVTIGNYGGAQYYVHGDFGGRIDTAGRVGYRLNVVRQDGETAIDDQKIDRKLASAAIDWLVTEQLLLELNAVYNNYKTQSPSAYWSYGAGVNHGRAPDAGKNWSQSWIHDEFENTKWTGKLTYRLNDHITLRGAYTRNSIDRPVQDHTMNSVFSDTEYRQLRQRAGETKDTFEGAQALADFSFATGAIAHKVTAGYHMYSAKSWSTDFAPHTGWVGPFPLSHPTRVPEFVFPEDPSSMYYAGKSVNRNFVIGDEIHFGERWSALAGISRSNITNDSFDSSGARIADEDYDKSRNSPSLSLMFKPAPWLTTYASYIEGLEMGGRAPATANNHDTVMPPMVSRQRELGLKADVGEMLLTAAVFEIEKANEYTNSDNFYTQSGRQNHKGIEFTATGKLTGELTVLGGLTVLDTEIRGGADDGKEPTDVAEVVAKIYSEYALPVPGLSLTGGVYYTGKQWAKANNTDRLPSYTTADLGVRYATAVAGTPVTLRVNVNNIADKNYWLNTYYVGAPRTVAFSAQMQF